MRYLYVILGIFLVFNNLVEGAIVKREYRLKNGLHVVLLKDDSSSLVAARTYVKAGSINEAPFLGSGLSHYLEHIVAGGSSTKRDEDAYKDLIAHLGGAFNAYTTVDHTAYYINTIPEKSADAIDMLYEWMFHCKFDEKEFERERDVIIREIEKSNASIGRQFYQLNSDNFYHYSALKYPVIGYLENFKQVKRDSLIEYYNKFYVPGNMSLVIGGDIDLDAVEAQIEKTFGQELEVSAPLMAFQAEPHPFAPRIRHEEGDTSVTYLSVRYPTITLLDSDLYPLDLLEFILAQGMESILYKRLVEDEKLVYSVSAGSYTPSISTGFFNISVEMELENKDKVLDIIREELHRIEKRGLKTEVIERAKRQKLAEDIFGVSSVEDVVSRVGVGLISVGSSTFFEDYVRRFKTVTEDDLKRVLRTYFDVEKEVISILSPRGTLIDDGKADAITVDSDTEVLVLDNGVRVLIKPDASMEKVLLRTFVLGGIRAETSSNNGVGSILADMWGKSSKRYERDKLRKMVEERGASIHAAMGYNTHYFSLDVLSEDFDDLIDVYSDALFNPEFLQQDFDEAMRQSRKQISKRQDDWFRYGAYKFKQIFYQSHPYALPFIGELDTLDAIALTDIKPHYDALMNPENMVIIVAGDIDKAKIKKQMTQAFNRKLTVSTDLNLTLAISRVFHDVPNAYDFTIPQDVVGFFMVFDGFSLKDVDSLPALDMLDSALSGMNYPGGRLHSLLRGKGYVYMVHANSYSGLEPGHFAIVALTGEEFVDDLSRIITEQVDNIKSELISEEEFLQAKAQVKYALKDQVSTLDSLAMIMATDMLYGLEFNHYRGDDARLDRVSRADIQDMAKQVLVNPQTFIFRPESSLETESEAEN